MSKANEIKKNIVELFNIDKLPEDKQEEMVKQIGTLIFQSVLIRILPNLEEAELAEYERLIEGGASQEALLDFFFDKVPNFLEIVTEESENFRKDSEKVMSKME